MKLKKIKNYILTFIICLLGAFAFNAIETKAYTSVGGIQVSESDSYYVYQGQKNLKVIFYGNSNNSTQITMFYYNQTDSTYAFYPSCTASFNDMNIICNGNRVNGSIGSSLPSASQNNLTITPIDSNTINIYWSKDNENQVYDLVDLSDLYYNQGYEEGYNTGNQEGYDEGYTEGYEDGVSSTVAYQEGYQAGYEAGYSENNTIPTIYVENSNMIYSTSAGSISVPINNYISGIGGKLDFTALLNFNFPVITTNPQRVIISIELLTPLSVDDELEFAFATGTEYYSIIFSDVTNGNVDITNSVSLSYNDIINNDNKIILSEINPNLTIDKIDTILIMADYENGILYGATSITDNTLSANIDENYQIGYNVGYIAGEQAGINTGRTEGYNLGYNAGLDFVFTNENTITGLVGTLFTMPVNMFKSIFDFEFLGINLTAFFLSLITLLVVIWLIKKFI